MTAQRLNASTAEAEAATADEHTPIVSASPPSSYRAAEDDGIPQASGTRREPEDVAKPRQRRRGDPNGASVSENQHESEPETEQHPNRDGWFRRTLHKYGPIELENKGSVARDHLALERTFLAWLRTSLSFAGIGIAVTQLFRLNTTVTDNDGHQPVPDAPANRLRRVGKPLGATFLAISVIVLLIGWRRYFESQFYIISGKFPASRGSIFLTTLAAFALVVATFVIVLVVDPSLFQGK